MISLGLAQPSVVLDLNRLTELECLGCDDGRVAIGALTRHRALERAGASLSRAAPLLPLAAACIGSVSIRNRGTMAGSLAHGDPAAEWPAVAIALGAELVLLNARGRRTVNARDFFLGPLTTLLEPDELLAEVRLPVTPARTGASVQELTYRHGDYAVVGVVAQLSLSTDHTIDDAHVALFSVGSTPLRVTLAERMLHGQGPQAFAAAAEAAQQMAEPITDATASAAYRRDMVGVFTRRALHEAYQRAVATSVEPTADHPAGT
jgi:carbon-monoxide dehydrogenase medium subunit